jgi:hypothetical protein
LRTGFSVPFLDGFNLGIESFGLEDGFLFGLVGRVVFLGDVGDLLV